MTPSPITLRSGIISVAGQPFLRFATSAQAAVWLTAHGWHLCMSERETYSFSK